MKKHFLSITLLLAVCALQAQTLYFQDNFDSYTAGVQLTVQNSTDDWFTWSGGSGTDQDPFISSAHSSSAPNALNITGINDIIYKFQNQTTGHYLIEMDFFVPSGSLGGHFNIQHYATPAQPAFYYYFNGLGECQLTVADVNYNFNIPINIWYPIKVDVNLDEDKCTLFSNGIEIHSWAFHYQTFSQSGLNQLGSLNLYAGYLENNEGGGNFFVDNFIVWEVSASDEGVFVINPEEPIELNVNFTGEKTINLSNQGGNSLDYEIIPVYIIPEVNHTSTGIIEITHCGEPSTNGMILGDATQYTFVTGFSPAMLQEHIGKTVKQFDFGLKGTNGILSAKLCIWDMGIMGMPSQNDPIYEQLIEVSSLIDGKNFVTLNTPWLIDGRYIFIGYDLTVTPNVVNGSIDATPLAQCNYLGRLFKSHGVWNLLPETYQGGEPFNGVWDMKIYVDGTPITPWMDLDHTSGKLQPDAEKDLKITFGADDIVEKCEKKTKLYFHSTDFYKEETILDVTVNFLVGIDELPVSDIKVYPNPTTGELRVTSYELPVMGIEIFDIYGRKQKAEGRMQKAEGRISEIGQSEIVINVSHLPVGVYFLRIDGKTYKVIKN